MIFALNKPNCCNSTPTSTKMVGENQTTWVTFKHTSMQIQFPKICTFRRFEYLDDDVLQYTFERIFLFRSELCEC